MNAQAPATPWCFRGRAVWGPTRLLSEAAKGFHTVVAGFATNERVSVLCGFDIGSYTGIHTRTHGLDET